MRSSCPGSGFTIAIGSPLANASHVVSPPGFPIARSAALINSCIRSVCPSTVQRTRLAEDCCETMRLAASRNTSFLPHTSATPQSRSIESTCANVSASMATPTPPPDINSIGASTGRLRLVRIAAREGSGAANAPMMGIPVTQMRSRATPWPTRISTVSSMATNQQSA